MSVPLRAETASLEAPVKTARAFVPPVGKVIAERADSAALPTPFPATPAAWPAETERPIGGFAKRAFDIGLSALLLIALAPLFALIAVLIGMESRGPILFGQQRGGFGGKTFKIFKFRTMTVLEQGAEVRQATRNDDRITRVGAFLRRTSLDEIPQLLNVLLGQMSLVGPRPHAVAHDRQFALVDPRYSQRQVARPGITGLAQVSGCRGPTETDDAVRARTSFDLRYIWSWSMGGDIKILWLTARLVLKDDKAF